MEREGGKEVGKMKWRKGNGGKEDVTEERKRRKGVREGGRKGGKEGSWRETRKEGEWRERGE
jgi:hypothetical protein